MGFSGLVFAFPLGNEIGREVHCLFRSRESGFDRDGKKSLFCIPLLLLKALSFFLSPSVCLPKRRTDQHLHIEKREKKQKRRQDATVGQRRRRRRRRRRCRLLFFSPPRRPGQRRHAPGSRCSGFPFFRGTLQRREKALQRDGSAGCDEVRTMMEKRSSPRRPPSPSPSFLFSFPQPLFFAHLHSSFASPNQNNDKKTLSKTG